MFFDLQALEQVVHELLRAAKPPPTLPMEQIFQCARLGQGKAILTQHIRCQLKTSSLFYQHKAGESVPLLRAWAYLGYFCQVSFVFAHGVFACCFVRSRPVATGSFDQRRFCFRTWFGGLPR